MKLTGDRLKELIGECESLVPSDDFWGELADLINEETKKDPSKDESVVKEQ